MSTREGLWSEDEERINPTDQVILGAKKNFRNVLMRDVNVFRKECLLSLRKNCYLFAHHSFI